MVKGLDQGLQVPAHVAQSRLVERRARLRDETLLQLHQANHPGDLGQRCPQPLRVREQPRRLRARSRHPERRRRISALAVGGGANGALRYFLPALLVNGALDLDRNDLSVLLPQSELIGLGMLVSWSFLKFARLTAISS